MIDRRKFLPSTFSRAFACAIVGVLAVAAAPASATTVVLPSDPAAADHGSWFAFDVDELSSRSFGVEWIDATDSLSPDFGSPIEFSFVIPAGHTGRLRVVDAGFAGDTFGIDDQGSLLGHSAAVPAGSYENAVDIGTDFAAAWNDVRFSRGEFQLGAGTHRITGWLDRSVTFGGLPLNATVGAVSLTVTSAVPEASTRAAWLAGLGVTFVLLLRRRRQR